MECQQGFDHCSNETSCTLTATSIFSHLQGQLNAKDQFQKLGCNGAAETRSFAKCE